MEQQKTQLSTIGKQAVFSVIATTKMCHFKQKTFEPVALSES